MRDAVAGSDSLDLCCFWQQLRVCRFRFRIRWSNTVSLPPFKGSAFRGVLGFSLRALVCSRHDADFPCTACPNVTSCPYAILFESMPLTDGRADRFKDIPKPFVILPPLSPREVYEAGDSADFDVLLVGSAISLFPAVAAAYALVGAAGFRGRDGRFAIESIRVVSEDEALELGHPADIHLDWFGNQWTAEQLDALPSLSFVRQDEEVADCVSLSLVTPMRLRKQGVLLARDLPFDFLIDRLCERAWLLGELYCDVVAPDFDDLVRAAASISVHASSLSWTDWTRNSARSGRVAFGGLTGTASYGGNMSPFLPLLRFGSAMGVGQGTTMGMGQYAMNVEP